MMTNLVRRADNQISSEQGKQGFTSSLLRRLRRPHERLLDAQSGKIGWALLWLLGVPLPVLLIAYLIWGR